MLITVITVCLNEEKEIGATIESVLNQRFSDYEYIICDGGSTDRTVIRANAYSAAFAQKGIRYRVHSEKDSGIYYGMNQGIRMAEGAYLHFLNAGDRYHADTVLAGVQPVLAAEAPDILYGDVNFVERGFGKVRRSSHAHLNSSMSICHQGMFIKSALMKERPYNTVYRIIADYDFTLEMNRAGKRFLHQDIVVADYRVGGVSTMQAERVAREYYEIQTRAGIPCNYERLLERAQRLKKSSARREKIPLPLFWIYSLLRGQKRMRR